MTVAVATVAGDEVTVTGESASSGGLGSLAAVTACGGAPALAGSAATVAGCETVTGAVVATTTGCAGRDDELVSPRPIARKMTRPTTVAAPPPPRIPITRWFESCPLEDRDRFLLPRGAVMVSLAGQGGTLNLKCQWGNTAAVPERQLRTRSVYPCPSAEFHFEKYKTAEIRRIILTSPCSPPAIRSRGISRRVGQPRYGHILRALMCPPASFSPAGSM